MNLPSLAGSARKAVFWRSAVTSIENPTTHRAAPMIPTGPRATLSVAVDKPLVIARKRSYGLSGEVEVDQKTGYSKGRIFLNDISTDDRVLIVDDVISTGGTMRAILSSIESMGAGIADVVIAFEKGDGMSRLVEERGWPMQSLVRLTMEDDQVVILD